MDALSVLHAACEHGRTDIIKTVLGELEKGGLLKPGDVRKLISTPREKDGATALHVAAAEGHTDVVRALLHAGADARARGSKTGQPFHGTTPLAVARTPEIKQAFVMEAFRQAAMGHASRLRELMEGGVSVDCTNGSSPHDRLVHWAASFGHEEVVDVLVGLGADVCGANDEGVTPLHEAVKAKKHGVVLRLIKAGADAGAVPSVGPLKGKRPADLTSDPRMTQLLQQAAKKTESPPTASTAQTATEDIPEDTPVCDTHTPAHVPVQLPLLWPPPRHCEAQVDASGVQAYAWVSRTVLLSVSDISAAPTGPSDPLGPGGVVETTIADSLRAHGCTVLPLAWGLWGGGGVANGDEDDDDGGGGDESSIRARTSVKGSSSSAGSSTNGDRSGGRDTGRANGLPPHATYDSARRVDAHTTHDARVASNVKAPDAKADDVKTNGHNGAHNGGVAGLRDRPFDGRKVGGGGGEDGYEGGGACDGGVGTYTPHAACSTTTTSSSTNHTSNRSSHSNAQTASASTRDKGMTVITVAVGRSLKAHEQAYRLTISPCGHISIIASDTRGALYGARALADLVKYYSLHDTHTPTHTHTHTHVPPPGAGDPVFRVPAVCVRDRPDTPNRAVYVSGAESPSLLKHVVQQLSWWRATSVHMCLPPTLYDTTTHRAANTHTDTHTDTHARTRDTNTHVCVEVAGARVRVDRVVASKLLQLQRHCTANLVDFVPVVTCAQDAAAAVLALPSVRQLSLLLPPPPPPSSPDTLQPILDSVVSVLQSIEAALVAVVRHIYRARHGWHKTHHDRGGDPEVKSHAFVPGGPWVLHVWGLSSASGAALQSAWLTRGTGIVAVLTHPGPLGGHVSEPTQHSHQGPSSSWHGKQHGTASVAAGSVIQGSTTGENAHVSTGGESVHISTGFVDGVGSIFHLRRVLDDLVKPSSRPSTGSGKPVQGSMVWAHPPLNVLCPGAISLFVAHVGLACAWSHDTVVRVLGVDPARPHEEDTKGDQPQSLEGDPVEYGPAIRTFAAHISTSHSLRRPPSVGAHTPITHTRARTHVHTDTHAHTHTPPPPPTTTPSRTAIGWFRAFSLPLTSSSSSRSSSPSSPATLTPTSVHNGAPISTKHVRAHTQSSHGVVKGDTHVYRGTGTAASATSASASASAAGSGSTSGEGASQALTVDPLSEMARLQSLLHALTASHHHQPIAQEKAEHNLWRGALSLLHNLTPDANTPLATHLHGIHQHQRTHAHTHSAHTTSHAHTREVLPLVHKLLSSVVRVSGVQHLRVDTHGAHTGVRVYGTQDAGGGQQGSAHLRHATGKVWREGASSTPSLTSASPPPNKPPLPTTPSTTSVNTNTNGSVLNGDTCDDMTDAHVDTDPPAHAHVCVERGCVGESAWVYVLVREVGVVAQLLRMMVRWCMRSKGSAVGDPLLLSPSLLSASTLSASARCDITNALLDLYEHVHMLEMTQTYTGVQSHLNTHGCATNARLLGEDQLYEDGDTWSATGRQDGIPTYVRRVTRRIIELLGVEGAMEALKAKGGHAEDEDGEDDNTRHPPPLPLVSLPPPPHTCVRGFVCEREGGEAVVEGGRGEQKRNGATREHREGSAPSGVFVV